MYNQRGQILNSSAVSRKGRGGGYDDDDDDDDDDEN